MRLKLLLFFLFLSLSSFAQQNLSAGYKGSVYTYIYKINADEATLLYNSGMQKVGESYLHRLVDYFERDEPVLASGNYLFAKAVRNKMEFKLKAVGDVSFKAINNNRDLVIALHTNKACLSTMQKFSSTIS